MLCSALILEHVIKKALLLARPLLVAYSKVALFGGHVDGTRAFLALADLEFYCLAFL
jgi:hypothetical protein